MLEEKNRKKIFITFVVGVIFILATLAVRWNAYSDSKEKLGALPLIYTIISIASISYLFRLAYILSDTKAFNNYLDLKVSEARAELLEEIRNEEEKKKNKETEVDDVPEIAKKLIPSGNFKNIDTIAKKILVNLANEMNLVQGVFYVVDDNAENYNFCVGYALESNNTVESFKLGENLSGEAAKTQEIMVVNEIPENYFMIESGLGKAEPGHLCIVPIVSDKETIAVIELASFTKLGDKNFRILEQAGELISKKIKQIVKA